MTQFDRIARALVKEGFLSENKVEAASLVLIDELNQEIRNEREMILLDVAKQEQMISGAKNLLEQDQKKVDKKGNKIDRAIIQDAVDQEEVDSSAFHANEKKIQASSRSAAEGLVKAGLIDKHQVKAAIVVIKQTWLEGDQE